MANDYRLTRGKLGTKTGLKFFSCVPDLQRLIDPEETAVSRHRNTQFGRLSRFNERRPGATPRGKTLVAMFGIVSRACAVGPAWAATSPGPAACRSPNDGNISGGDHAHISYGCGRNGSGNGYWRVCR